MKLADKLTEDDKEEIRKMLRVCELKNPDWEETLYRLFTLSPTPEEKEWWESMGIWKRGRIHMSTDEMENLPVTFALWHLARMKILKRVVREG